MLLEAISQLSTLQLVVIIFSLVLAFAFEFVNGFHDAANAVATVIYTRSMRPNVAVAWSDFFNFLGTMLGGIGVAFAIVHLLPLELLVKMNSGAGLVMVLSLLGAAILWNVGTWSLGIPASSSHTLIGSIIGVGIAHSLYTYGDALHGVNYGKVWDIGLSLLFSPLIGFFLSGALLILLKFLRPGKSLHQSPEKGARPPGWIRGTLILTCTGVSFAHGSNDGQKGMGLVMLILVGLMPMQFALNMGLGSGGIEVRQSAQELHHVLVAQIPAQEEIGMRPVALTEQEVEVDNLLRSVERVSRAIGSKDTFSELPSDQRWHLRVSVYELDRQLSKFLKTTPGLLKEDRAALISAKSRLRNTIEYVPTWVVLMVALCLGIGTMIGWKRVVVTVGEKIGKAHLTYGQGATAELVAMTMIGLADIGGLPVSTTHVLSSGVAGTMWANKSGVNRSTVRNILLAWVLTLPVSMLLSGGLFFLGRWLIA